MGEDVNQGATTAPQATASPSEPIPKSAEPDNSISRTDYDSLQTKYDELNGNHQKIQEYFSSNPRLYDAAVKYSEDPSFKENIHGLLEGKPTSNGDGKVSKSTLDLSSFDDDQRQVIQDLIQSKIQSEITPVKGELDQLRQYYANSEIEKLGQKYTVDKGWPMNFDDNKTKIGELINKGKAIDAETAFLQLVANKMPEIKGQHEKAILDTKRNSSMSRYQASSTLPIKSKDFKPKTMLEAIEQAEEQTGSVLSDRLRT